MRQFSQFSKVFFNHKKDEEGGNDLHRIPTSLKTHSLVGYDFQTNGQGQQWVINNGLDEKSP